MREKIKHYLKKKGIEQAYISNASNIHMLKLKAILNNEKTLYLDDLEKICKALEISPSLFSK